MVATSTDLEPENRFSVEGHFEKSSLRALVYLPASAIAESTLNDFIDEPKTAFYFTCAIHVAVIHKLNQKGLAERLNGLLRTVLKATTMSLQQGITYCKTERARTPPFESMTRQDLLTEEVHLKIILLNGEQCQLWKKGEIIGAGRLTVFKLNKIELDDRMYNCDIWDFLSGKYRFEKQDASTVQAKATAVEEIQGRN